MKRRLIAWLCACSLGMMLVGCVGSGNTESTPTGSTSSTVVSGDYTTDNNTSSDAESSGANDSSSDFTQPSDSENNSYNNNSNGNAGNTVKPSEDNSGNTDNTDNTNTNNGSTNLPDSSESGDLIVINSQKDIRVTLKKGINVSGFQNIEPYAVTLAAETYTMLKNKGFDHVRLPVNFMSHIEDFPNDTTISEDFLRQVDIAVNAALDAGLAVILDFHGMSDTICENVSMYEQAFYDMWEQLAIRYQRSSDNIYFELINEPSQKSGEDTMTNERLNTLMNNTIKIIRKYNPTRPILVAVNNWNGVWNIDSVDIPSVEEDPNLIVTVHMYEIMAFTHQGASWDPSYSNTGLVPFDDSVKNAIENSFQKIVEWKKANGNREVYIGEFGVNQELDNQAEVVKYAEFFASRCKELNLSWGYWELTNSFGAYLGNNEWKDFVAELLK